MVHYVFLDFEGVKYRRLFRNAISFLRVMHSGRRIDKGLDETGVVGVVCRHEFPKKFLSILRGERLD